MISKSDFKVKTVEENAQSIADLMPSGDFWKAKNITNSNLRKFLNGFSVEIQRYQGETQSLAEDYIPNRTSSFIDEWERIVGIPDDCFTKDGVEPGDSSSDEGRRRDIIVKLGYMNIQTQQDYIDLAAQFGVSITINNSTGGFNQFNWEINFSGAGTSGWDYPWTPPDEIVWENAFVDLLICIFNKQRPAHTLLNYTFV